MKALTLMEPWATLVALAGHPDPEVRKLAKRIETRSWPTKYRGPLAIHASQRTTTAVYKWLVNSPEGNRILEALAAAGYTHLMDLPYGKILCTVTAAGCYQITLDNRPPEPEFSYGDYTPGRWAWPFTDTQTLPDPIPAKGSLGLWTPTLELFDAIYAQIGRPEIPDDPDFRIKD